MPGPRSLIAATTPVHTEVDTVDRFVAQQEVHRVHDVPHAREPSRGRLGAVVLQYLRGLARPEGAVADDARVDGVDADRGEFAREGAHQARDARVHRGDGRGARVGPFLGLPAEDHYGARPAHPGQQRVDHLGVADELEGDQVQRGVDVIVGDGVLVAGDAREDEVVDSFDARQGARDLARSGQVEGQPVRADLLGSRVGAVGVAAGEYDLVAAFHAGAGELSADAGRTADDDNTAHGLGLSPGTSRLTASSPLLPPPARRADGPSRGRTGMSGATVAAVPGSPANAPVPYRRW